MIGGLTQGAGGAALGNHLADTKGQNEETRPGSSRGLYTQGIQEQVAELTKVAGAARSRKPIAHFHGDPPEGAAWGDKEFDDHWARLEQEFGLERQPYSEVVHVKHGREHRQRAYSLLKKDGTCICLSNAFQRNEKLSRLAEFDTGHAFTKGAHNRAVIAALEAGGRHDVAEAMRAATLDEGPPARAALTPRDRAQQDRTGMRKHDVASAVAQAWAASDSGHAFAAALAEHGLVLARGDRRGGVPVIVDGTGNTHAVARMLNMAAKADGTPSTPAADVAARLDGMALPSVAEARQAVAAHPPPPPDDGPLPPDASPPSGGEEAASVSNDAPHVPAPTGHAEVAPAHAAAQATPGAALDDAGPGPGEPPGPTASPEELARFRARLAAYDDRKAAAWARWVASQQQATPPAAPSGGGHHGTVQQIDGWTPAVAPGHAAGETHATIRAAPIGRHARRLACEQDGSPGQDEDGTGNEQRHDRAGGGDGPAARGHHPGDAPEDRGSVEPVARLGSAAAGRGAEPDYGNPVRADGGAGIATSDRAAAGGAAADARAAIARRAAEDRLAHGLAESPDGMTGMRRARQELDPIWRDARDARRRIHADQAHIAAILATHPHPDPASRDPATRADAYAHAISERTRQRTAAVDAAQAQATAAFQGRSRTTRLLAFVGIATAEQRQAERLVARAVDVTDASDPLPTRDDYTRARADGEAHAYAAQQTTAAWEKRPDVAAAMEQHRLNQSVQQAVQAGDPAIKATMEAGDPDAARAIIQQREKQQAQRAFNTAQMDDLARGQHIADAMSRLHGHVGATPLGPGQDVGCPNPDNSFIYLG